MSFLTPQDDSNAPPQGRDFPHLFDDFAASDDDMGGSRGSESQGDLAETAGGKERTTVSTNEEQTVGMRQAEGAEVERQAAVRAQRQRARWMIVLNGSRR